MPGAVDTKRKLRESEVGGWMSPKSHPIAKFGARSPKPSHCLRITQRGCDISTSNLVCRKPGIHTYLCECIWSTSIYIYIHMHTHTHTHADARAKSHVHVYTHIKMTQGLGSKSEGQDLFRGHQPELLPLLLVALRPFETSRPSGSKILHCRISGSESSGP